jgi:hypothetical protein
VEFFKSEKSSRILNISGFWHFFQIFKIPLLSTSKGHAKWFKFVRFSVRSCAVLCGGKSGSTLHGLYRYFKVEFFRSVKSSRVLRSSRFCHYFQIFKIPLLSTLKGQSKFLHFFVQGYFCLHQAVWRLLSLCRDSKSGTQTWNIHTHTDPVKHPASHWSIRSHFWV